MLSEKMQTLAEYFARFAETGVTLMPDALKAVIGTINALTVEAVILEQTIIPAAARQPDAPISTVVAFPASRRRSRAVMDPSSGGAA